MSTLFCIENSLLLQHGTKTSRLRIFFNDSSAQWSAFSANLRRSFSSFLTTVASPAMANAKPHPLPMMVAGLHDISFRNIVATLVDRKPKFGKV